MKVLFLDIDGVLNTPSAKLGFKYALGLNFEDYYRGDDILRCYSSCWDPSALYNLYRIVDETKCKIVVSSTWRRGETIESMQAWFQVPTLRDAIIDKTPSLHLKWKDTFNTVPRGVEINAWISQYQKDNGRESIESVAILDDDSDMWPQMRNFFQTHGYDGLTWDVATKVIKHLNGNTKDVCRNIF